MRKRVVSASDKKQKKTVIILFSIVVLMFGFGYALVPLYNVMCKQLGLNGKITGPAPATQANEIDQSRMISVEFIATNNEQLPWKFFPNTTKIRFHPGEMQRIYYHAKNLSDHTMTVQAIPSVTPGLAAKYLKKTECFCFTQQTLGSQQEMNMPILFHIDPNLPKDIHTVTLSYTLFDVTGMRLKPSQTPGRIG